ncbi:MAG: hypothetical protein M1833_002429, partial [Piccolia ochrophora]
SLLASTTTSTTPAPPPSKPTTAQTLASFLPFARPIKPYPRSSSPLPTAPSHHPLPSTPLIHLRLFTPLTITSTSSLPTAISQSISITLHAPSHTLTTTLALTVSLATHALTSLTVHHLTPWAEPELGTWIRARAAGTACPAAGHDVAGACWAVGRYWEVALKRALCWRRCARAWGALCVGLEGSGGEGDHDGDDTGEEDSAAEPKEWSRAEITPLLGRDEVVFRAPNRGDDADAGGGGVQVFVRWRVGFDWTGEAESRVEAGVKRVPRSWRDADERASLARIPALFETLVEERGVFGATRVVVGMVFPEMGERGV